MTLYGPDGINVLAGATEPKTVLTPDSPGLSVTFAEPVAIGFPEPLGIVGFVPGTYVVGAQAAIAAAIEREVQKRVDLLMAPPEGVVAVIS